MDSKAVIEKLQKGFADLLKEKEVDQKKIDILCLCQATSLPGESVKIVKAARQLGLEVYGARLPGGVSGMLNIRKNQICLEETDSLERQRFTCAHEIGHFILHEKVFLGDKFFGDVLFRSDITGKLEREANSMAAEILMPIHFLKNFVGDDMPMDDMARIFKVSGSAIKYRIKALGDSIEEKYLENNAARSFGRGPVHDLSSIKDTE